MFHKDCKSSDPHTPIHIHTLTHTTYHIRKHARAQLYTQTSKHQRTPELSLSHSYARRVEKKVVAGAGETLSGTGLPFGKMAEMFYIVGSFVRLFECLKP